MLQTIGITKFGIHWLGFSNELNQSIPILTKIVPKTATNKTPPIDNMIFNSCKTLSEMNDCIEQQKLPKGIQKKTLILIQEYFDKNPGWHTVIMIAEKLGISIVTARHYMNYLEAEDIITSEINYGTGGRPCILYKRKNGKLV